MTGTARHTGHHIEDLHYPRLTAGIDGWIRCECGWDWQDRPDLALPDPWQPLHAAYAAHRVAAKAGPPRLAGESWRAMSLLRDRAS